MSKCAVKGCKSIYNPFNGGISFHRVTRNKKYLPLWQKVVTIKSTAVNPKICSLHFKNKDFIEGRDRRRVLKPDAVPSINVTDNDYTDDEDDDENLSMLKRSLIASSVPANEDTLDTAHTDEKCYIDQTRTFEMVMSCCNSGHPSNLHKQTNNIGIQTKIKSDKEISLQARVKLLELRLKRRDAKISYMKTVLNMIKKHTKGTDMEYKLCCELRNISECSDPVTTTKERRRENNLNKIGAVSPVCDNSEMDSSGDETGVFVEVVHSSNLNRRVSF